MKRLKTALRILYRNSGVLAGFELIYKLVTTALLIPLIYGTINLTMRVTGYNYLTAENVRRFLTHPLFFLCPLILIAAISIYLILDVGAIIYIMDQSYHRRKTDILKAFRFSVKNARFLLHAKRILVVPILILVMMVFSVSLIPGVLDRFLRPAALLRSSMKHPLIMVVILVVLVLVLVLFLHWMYAFHYVALEGCSVTEACRRSSRLGKGHHLTDILVFAVQQGLYFLFYAGLVALELFLLTVLSRLFPWSDQLRSLSTSVTLIVMLITLIGFTVMGPPFAYICISMLYYDHKQKNKEEIISLPVQKHVAEEEAARDPDHDGIITEAEQAQYERNRKRNRKRVLYIEWGMIAASVFALSMYIYGLQKGWFNPNIEYLHTMEVTAHRGASAFYPENTMAAFAGAAEQGADWIELDVHMSSDGQIFVMHDSSFKRTTGVSQYAWALTYAEIAGLDAGSFFGPEFAGERIPLLTEAIACAKEEGIRLNIEIKPSAQETGLEDKLVQIVQEEDFGGSCVVTSQNYSSIERVKELDESITTVYVMGFAYGGIDRLEAADAFSVRHTSITDTLIRRVHNRGKQIYAWTVNNRYNINEMISKNVDNIITDNVPLAKDCIEKSQTGDAETEFLRIINNLLDSAFSGI